VLAKLRATAGFLGFVRNWGAHYLATYGRKRPGRLVALPGFVVRTGFGAARPR
jgi:hypothetical protein